MTEQEINQLIAQLKKIDDDLETIDSKVDMTYFELFGVPNSDDKGMCGEFKELKEDYTKFKNNATKIFFYLLGAGVLGTGVYELIKYL
jgi:hypothetical protein